jgi:hypothetical protein
MGVNVGVQVLALVRDCAAKAYVANSSLFAPAPQRAISDSKIVGSVYFGYEAKLFC